MTLSYITKAQKNHSNFLQMEFLGHILFTCLQCPDMYEHLERNRGGFGIGEGQANFEPPSRATPLALQGFARQTWLFPVPERIDYSLSDKRGWPTLSAKFFQLLLYIREIFTLRGESTYHSDCTPVLWGPVLRNNHLCLANPCRARVRALEGGSKLTCPFPIPKPPLFLSKCSWILRQ